jgi:hypothetical protein
MPDPANRHRERGILGTATENEPPAGCVITSVQRSLVRTWRGEAVPTVAYTPAAPSRLVLDLFEIVD